MNIFRKPQTREIRWMIRRDMDDCVYIDSKAFDETWDEDEFQRVLRNRDIIGVVAESRNEIDGYMIYRLKQQTLEIIRMAVQLDERRLGVGSMLLERLIDKLETQRRRFIEVDVPERCVGAQLFFSANGFTAWQDAGSDVVSMRFERIG